MSLQSEIDALRRLTHELFDLGLDGEPIYTDRFCQLNTDVYHQAELLFSKRGDTVEEEATLCIALLMGYNATIYNYGDKEEKVQCILTRSWDVLDRLSTSLLKCQLLVVCYGETFEEELAEGAHAIISSWSEREFTDEEQEVIDCLRNLEENPYSWSEVE